MTIKKSLQKARILCDILVSRLFTSRALFLWNICEHFEKLLLCFICFFPHFWNERCGTKTRDSIYFEKIKIFPIIPPVHANDSSTTKKIIDLSTLFFEGIFQSCFDITKDFIWAIRFIFFFVVKKLSFFCNDLDNRKYVCSTLVSVYSNRKFLSFDTFLNKRNIMQRREVADKCCFSITEECDPFLGQWSYHFIDTRESILKFFDCFCFGSGKRTSSLIRFDDKRLFKYAISFSRKKSGWWRQSRNPAFRYFYPNLFHDGIGMEFIDTESMHRRCASSYTDPKSFTHSSDNTVFSISTMKDRDNKVELFILRKKCIYRFWNIKNFNRVSCDLGPLWHIVCTSECYGALCGDASCKDCDIHRSTIERLFENAKNEAFF